MSKLLSILKSAIDLIKALFVSKEKPKIPIFQVKPDWRNDDRKK